MATRKDILLGQVFLAIGRGAGKAHLSDESVSWLYDRYAAWLETKITKTGLSPLEDWEKYGASFLQQFAKIGEGAATVAAGPTGLRAEVSSAQTAALTVEGSEASNCPYCPDGGGI